MSPETLKTIERLFLGRNHPIKHGMTYAGSSSVINELEPFASTVVRGRSEMLGTRRGFAVGADPIIGTWRVDL